MWAAEQAARKLEGAASLTAAASAWRPPNADEVYNLNAVVRRLEEETDPARQRLVSRVAAAYNLDLRNPLIEGVLRQLGQHITRVADDQRDAIMTSLDTAWHEGLSIPNAAELVMSASRDLSVTRATMIARTEMIGAVNGGSLAAVRTGRGARYKTWLATDDSRTREDHADADGTTVGIDEAFYVGDSAMMYPGDPDGSPGEVINCRCTLIYGDEA